MKLIGYARVSTDDQSAIAQVEQLKKAGCRDVYTETAPGGRWDRPQLHKLLNRLGKGNVLVVWKLDRLSRSLSDLLHILKLIKDAGAGSDANVRLRTRRCCCTPNFPNSM